MNPISTISSSSQPTNKSNYFRSCYVFSFLVLPVLLAFILYTLDPSDPIALPDHHHHHNPTPKPRVIDGSILPNLERVGSGRFTGPEDLVYDPISKVLYTGCRDGSIKRVVMGDGSGFEDGSVAVEELVNTGGRPLGLALSHSADGYDNELIIADAYKGLLKLTKDSELVQLTKEAEGKEFKLTDGVDVAKDGIIYFTDASSNRDLDSFIVDQLNGRPYGRLLSFDPITGETRVLLRDLYFPNGVAIAPDQSSLIFCETMLRMCKRYHITGTLAGSFEPFINNTFGSPDNIHYDGEGRYWIGIPTYLPDILHKVMNNPSVRKGAIIAEKYIGLQGLMKSAGVLVVDLEGNPIAHLYDKRLSAITSGIKIGQHLYLGSLYYEHIFRLNLTQYVF